MYHHIGVFSTNSIDSNAVGGPGPVYDSIEERGMTLNMFTEDTHVADSDVSPLEAALRLHDMQNARDAPDTRSTSGIVTPDDVDHVSFVNNAFSEGVESSEI